MSGWGSGSWGSSPWGTGVLADGDGPIVTFVDPVADQTGVSRTKSLTFSVTDDTGSRLGSLRVSVSGTEYITGGSAVNGATATIVANAGNGFDVTLSLPEPFANLSRQSLTVIITDDDDQTTSATIFFVVGVGPRLISAVNVAPGLLVANFNRPMRLGSTFEFEGNWKITPVLPDTSPITVNEVVSSTIDPDSAILRISGGGSPYILTVGEPVVDATGEPLEEGFNSVQFELIFEEEPVDTIRLFDSIFGPLGITQRRVKRRTVDRHTADRSLAVALDEQLRLRFQQVGSSAARDGREGIRRT